MPRNNHLIKFKNKNHNRNFNIHTQSSIVGFHILAFTLHMVVVISGLRGVKQSKVCMCNVMVVAQ